MLIGFFLVDADRLSSFMSSAARTSVGIAITSWLAAVFARSYLRNGTVGDFVETKASASDKRRSSADVRLFLEVRSIFVFHLYFYDTHAHTRTDVTAYLPTVIGRDTARARMLTAITVWWLRRPLSQRWRAIVSYDYL